MFENTKQFTDYDFPSAVADLIDNSLFSKAKNIEILCEWNDGDPIIRVIDDGEGMDKTELIKAMEWASTGFNEERDSSDHGRFGLGLKIASMSQCDHMIVASIKNKKINVSEKKVLIEMLSNPGKTFSREAIGKISGIIQERSIDVMITRLRQKLELNPKNPKYLQTIRGSGYVLWIE